MANCGNMAKEQTKVVDLSSPLVADFSNFAEEYPLVANYGNLAMGHPLVADKSNLFREHSLVVYLGRAYWQLISANLHRTTPWWQIITFWP